ILSFIVVGLCARHPARVRGYPRIDLTTHRFGRWLVHPIMLALLKFIGAGALILTVIAGFFRNQDPYRNIAPTLVWIIWWVGFAMLSAFAGDLWRLFNPWRTLFDWAELPWQRLSGRRLGSLPFPPRPGGPPAVVLLFAVSWTELVFPSPAAPANIALLATGYSLLTWAGMALFGGDTWGRQGEVFALFFGLFARFAPSEPAANGMAL